MSACAICGTTECEAVFQASDRLYHTTTERFSVVRCRTCGLLRLDPQPDADALGRYYPGNYWFTPDESAAGKLEEWYRRLVLRDHVRFVRRALGESGARGPLLDGGCGGGLFVLVRTSNQGAGDVQDLEVEGGQSVSERLAAIVARLGSAGAGEAGINDVGAVVGATAPEWLERLRALMPATVFLLPGVGAQGGRVEDLAPAFAPGPAGALISASRGIVNAYERVGGDPAVAAQAEAARLRKLAWNLAA